jgi:hypothetical protein
VQAELAKLRAAAGQAGEESQSRNKGKGHGRRDFDAESAPIEVIVLGRNVPGGNARRCSSGSSALPQGELRLELTHVPRLESSAVLGVHLTIRQGATARTASVSTSQESCT